MATEHNEPTEIVSVPTDLTNEEQFPTEPTSDPISEPMTEPTTPTQQIDGFIAIDGEVYYYQNNLPLKSSWINNEGSKYRTDKEGRVIRNSLFTVKTKTYFANKEGKVEGNQWITFNKKKYRSKASGALYIDKVFTVKSSKYYASEKGYISKSKFVNYNGKRYYTTSSGKIKTNCTFNVQNKIYIAKKSGALRCSERVTYKGKKCVSGKNGALLKKKSLTINRVKYYTGKDYSINKVIIDAPIISQKPELPTGCELTATTMLIGFYDNKTYKNTQFYNEVKKYVSPTSGYNGDPKKHGNIYCYPGAVEPLIEKHIGEAVRLKNTDEIKKKILEGKPVVCWMNNLDNFGLHCVLVTGYDKTGFYFNDPWFNPSPTEAEQSKNKRISATDFQIKFRGMGSNAVSY